MDYRRLHGLQADVSAIALGCASFGSRVDRRQSTVVLHKALDSGINFFDTAPLYGESDSETILGNALRGRRDNVVLSTKVGWLPSRLLSLASKSKQAVRALVKTIPRRQSETLQAIAQRFIRSSNVVDLRPEAIVASVESSLRRLQSEYVDILLLHKAPPAEKLEDTLATLSVLVDHGKIRTFGVSPHSIGEAMMWLELQHEGLSVLQVELNAFNLTASEQLLSLAACRRVSVVAREPFAQGRLIPPSMTKRGGTRFLGKSYDERFEFLVDPGARTLPQAALKLLLQNPNVTATLVGMSTVDHLEENLEAFGVPSLTAQELAAIDRLLP